MKIVVLCSCLLSILFEPCTSDIYFHFPPGSNNRLNGNGVNRRNARRLFDSQNNGKAGYNVGDSMDHYDGNRGDNISEFRQLPMEFYMSGCDEKAKTEVEIMWTNQHGTGPKTDDRVESQVILQYMCQPYPKRKMASDDVNTEFEYHTIRNGQERNTQNFRNRKSENSFIRKDLGLHEPLNYYQAYFRRERNKGLFTADRRLRRDQATRTRQNSRGTRRGLEVPEERDYYPYWGPTPWNDIAIMVSNNKTLDLMKRYIESSEYWQKYMCIMPTRSRGNQICPNDLSNAPAKKCVAKHITAESCEAVRGREWKKFITNFIEKNAENLTRCLGQGDTRLVKGVPYEPHKLSQGSDQEEQFVLLQKRPEVIFAPSTVVNHNGMNMEGKFSSFKWKVPFFPSNVKQRCVLRIRYNITSADVPREFSAKDNQKLKNDPTTLAVDGNTTLQLALNTAQVGRTFQDRTHVILLKPRTLLPAKYQNSKIFYIGGMGKRGNIVQTYPAMEYRFTPERISVTTDDVLCFVWSGSNNNRRNQAGEGKDRTDRTNVCWVKEGCSSLKPENCSSLPLEVVDHVDEFDANKLNLHLNKGCYTGDNLQAELDNAPASCNPPCFRITKPGEYCYMSTRNNNFSNRRHMGQITVTQAVSA